MIKTITSFLLLLTMSMFSQNVTISFEVKAIDQDCINSKLLKKISVESLSKNKIIFENSFDQCFIEINIPKSNDNLLLVVEAENYKSSFINFNLSNSINNKLKLSNIVLQEQKSLELEEIVLTFKKENVEINANKTTIRVKGNDILENNSSYEALTKIPGVLNSPGGGGLSINGRGVTIYIDGIRSSLNGEDLNSYLQSLPANSIEKIELIENPGASFDANLTGAVINIITDRKKTEGYSGSISYAQKSNERNIYAPSLLFDIKKGKTSYQFFTGYTYFESLRKSEYNSEFTFFEPNVFANRNSILDAERSLFFFRPNFVYNINDKSKLIVNYKLNYYNNDVNNSGSFDDGINLLFSENNIVEKKSFNEVVIKYKKEFESNDDYIEFSPYYSNFKKNSTNFSTQLINGTDSFGIVDLDSDINNFYFKSDYNKSLKNLYDINLTSGIKYNYLKASNIGGYNLNNPDSNIFSTPNFNEFRRFKYEENTFALYTELSKKFDKISITAGVRWEDFNLISRTNNTVTNEFKTNNFFPSFSFDYKLNKSLKLLSSYSRKSTLPAFSDLDPNIIGNFDNFINETGNPLLNPNFSDNYRFSVNAFTYFNFNVNHTYLKDMNFRYFIVPDNSTLLIDSYRSFRNVNFTSITTSFPIPIDLILKGKQNTNNKSQDKMNYIYVTTIYNKHNVSSFDYNFEKKPFWYFNILSHFVLPHEIKLMAQYSHVTPGTYQIFELKKPINFFNVSIAKNFYDNKLKLMVAFEDIFNTNKINGYSNFTNLNTTYNDKLNTQLVSFRISYDFNNNKNLKLEKTDIKKDEKELDKEKTIINDKF